MTVTCLLSPGPRPAGPGHSHRIGRRRIMMVTRMKLFDSVSESVIHRTTALPVQGAAEPEADAPGDKRRTRRSAPAGPARVPVGRFPSGAPSAQASRRRAGPSRPRSHWAKPQPLSSASRSRGARRTRRRLLARTRRRAAKELDRLSSSVPPPPPPPPPPSSASLRPLPPPRRRRRPGPAGPFTVPVIGPSEFRVGPGPSHWPVTARPVVAGGGGPLGHCRAGSWRLSYRRPPGVP